MSETTDLATTGAQRLRVREVEQRREHIDHHQVEQHLRGAQRQVDQPSAHAARQPPGQGRHLRVERAGLGVLPLDGYILIAEPVEPGDVAWCVLREQVQLAGERRHDDRLDQRGVIAAGNVAASDRSAEQHVADMGKAHVAAEKHHAAR